ncbi:aminotransferase class I/II-fold pyridoxal phosphate-dependent enzyme [Neolewinella aurantiaca]|uniref:Aminotransferase n=1 Tax=Neolewinella aurantiaca TaxID=2602767 RepID=A0A5C7FVT2_9BACT|nr:aminotransferase class I/II-fold pyridoxal phosphate-dependent enzyme [Neolewinella aurantiaca]TXF88932.1 aminotransferase class I/II-fold pyridoxal phosphate-dependent enzyme [Neolewinella aurantiaca]
MSLSQRGKSAANQPLRADLDAFYEAMDDKYDAQDNPEGKFTLTIAENCLSWPQLRDKFRRIQAENETPGWVASYTSILGAPELREAAAAFLQRHFSGCPLNPERLGVAAGAAAIIEMTALLLGDPGDVAVIPGPAYMAYTPDIGAKAGMERYDLQHQPTAGEPDSRFRFPTYFQHTTADLDRAYAELGNRFRVLILTQPNNPTGQVFTESQILAFADWCEAHKVHLVVNEIYGLSLIDQDHEDLIDDYGERRWFTSVLPLLESRKSEYFHWWYSFSKDFGISGFRMGMIYSHNEQMLEAWGNIGSTSMASNHSQWLVQRMLEDEDWVREYISDNSRRLTESYALVVRTLRAANIAYAPAAGSLFVWFDLSNFLRADTAEAEMELWQRVYDETGILLTSPVGQGSPERGWYRMVYSCVSYAELEVAMERLKSFLQQA